jgi:hypothetical protein
MFRQGYVGINIFDSISKKKTDERGSGFAREYSDSVILRNMTSRGSFVIVMLLIRHKIYTGIRKQ